MSCQISWLTVNLLSILYRLALLLHHTGSRSSFIIPDEKQLPTLVIEFHTLT